MDSKENRTVIATYETLMDYYKGNADYLQPQPVIRDVELSVKTLHSYQSFGRVNIKFVYVTETSIELRVSGTQGDRFTMLIMKGDNTTELHITYNEDLNF